MWSAELEVLGLEAHSETVDWMMAVQTDGTIIEVHRTGADAYDVMVGRSNTMCCKSTAGIHTLAAMVEKLAAAVDFLEGE